MTERLVFLDIDGVLNHRAWFERGQDECPPNTVRELQQKLDPASVGLLNQLVVRTRALVVVSSTWRVHHSAQKLELVLRKRGFIGEVIAITPDLQKGGSRARRGNDIQAFLDSYGYVHEHIVILDDDSDMGHLMPFLVNVDNQVGLTQTDIDLAVKVLFERTLTEHALPRGTP